MSQYIGRRIVPVHGDVWDNSKNYEELTIVLHEASGDSYISRRPVPAGTVIGDKNYWMLYSLYSQQIADAVAQMEETDTALRKELSDTEGRMENRVTGAENLTNSNKAELNGRMDGIDKRLDANVAASTEKNANYAAEVVDARVGADGIVYSSLGNALRGSGDIARLMAFLYGRHLLKAMPFCSIRKSDSATADPDGGYTIPAGGYVFLTVDGSDYLSDKGYFVFFQSSSKMDVECAVTDRDGITSGANEDRISMKNMDEYYFLYVSAELFDSDKSYLKVRIDNRNGLKEVKVADVMVMPGNAEYPDYPEYTDCFKLGFVLTGGDWLEFDRKNEQVILRTTVYLFFEEKRYDIPAQSVSYASVEGTTNSRYLVYNPYEGIVSVVPFREYSPDTIIITAFNCSNSQLLSPTNILNVRNYYVDGVKYPLEEKKDKAATIVYVSKLGDDSNDGSATKPYKTVSKAIASKAETILIAPGKYRENISCSNRDKLSILCSWTGFVTSAPDRPKVVLEGGEDIVPVLDNMTGLLAVDYYSVEDDTIFQVFVSQKLEATDSSSSRSVGYNVTLWELGSAGNIDVRLAPVMALDECQETIGTWYYSGTKIYINPASENNGGYILSCSGSSGINITNVRSLVLEDIVVEFFDKTQAVINYCNDVSIRNCEFSHSALGEGLNFNYSNGSVYGCKAMYNRNDGFNIHGYGDSNFINCIGYNNYDDGISHHDGCTGTIVGGEYYSNNKGGVASPTHGAKIDVYNVFSHDNGYGIYTGASSDRIPKDSVISGCCLCRNNVGIVASRYRLVCFNNCIANNQINKSVSDNGTIEELSS